MRADRRLLILDSEASNVLGTVTAIADAVLCEIAGESPLALTRR